MRSKSTSNMVQVRVEVQRGVEELGELMAALGTWVERGSGMES